jgi:geranylgeranyl pyrophosphate synthase
MNLQELKTSLDLLPLEMTYHTISPLTHELNSLVHAGGKKFRPGLMLLMGEVFGLKGEDLQVYARAVELTHVASLVHDDVIDESDSRRNHPTLNHLRNNTTAILAGDYLLATIMFELAQAGNNEILIDLTKSIQDLADGEWLQYDLKRKIDVSVADLRLISVKKTGSLIRWCCTTPAKLAGHNDIESMRELGEKIGLIFQMADDIVDGLHHGGREPFQDLSNGQLNFVSLKLIELFPELKTTVLAFKDKTETFLPWTSEQYEKAILGVDADIRAEKARVLEIFCTLTAKTKRQDLTPLFDAMVSRIQMNYASFFETKNTERGA